MNEIVVGLAKTQAVPYAPGSEEVVQGSCCVKSSGGKTLKKQVTVTVSTAL